MQTVQAGMVTRRLRPCRLVKKYTDFTGVAETTKTEARQTVKIGSEPVFFLVLDGMDSNAADVRGRVAPNKFGGEGSDPRNGDPAGAFRCEHELVNAVFGWFGIHEGHELRVYPSAGSGFGADSRDDLSGRTAIHGRIDAIDARNHGSVNQCGIN